MKLASVILDIQTRGLSAPFTYAVVDEFDEENIFSTENVEYADCLDYPECPKNIENKKIGVPKNIYCNLIDACSKLKSRIDLSSLKNGEHPVEVGCMVLVPFGPQFKCGFVVDIFDFQEGKLTDPKFDSKKLKPVIMSVSKPYFDKSSVDFAKFLSDEYIAPLSTCIRLFLPPGAEAKTIKGPDGWKLKEASVGQIDDRFVRPGKDFLTFEPRTNAIKQKQILDVLKNGEIKASELKLEFGAVDSTLKALEKNGAVEVIHKRKYRQPDMPSSDLANYSQDPNKFSLTEGQKNAVEAIDKAFHAGCGDVILLDGVTGSGKTEVYLQAISKALKQEKTACVLVPEISLTPQTVARFRQRFGDQVAVMHSAMSKGERFDQWDFIRSGHAKVVVGARSALFSPLKNIGLIVIDEEHESSYKQDSAPRYVSRDCAVWLAKKHGAAVVLGSATPSIESLYNCNKLDSWTRVVLSERTNNKQMPKIDIVDMGMEFKSGSKKLFSFKLAGAISEELEAGHKVVLLHNRRGYANYMFCRDCGYIPTCGNCSTALTYHERLHVEDFTCGYDLSGTKNMLACHHCGHLEAPPVRCPKCGSPYIAKLGAGTQSVEDQLQQLIDGLDGQGKYSRIVRMDADTTKNKGGHQRLLDEFAQPGPAVLLGTQMIAKGLDFDEVTLVGVVLADTNLTLPDFRSAEKTFDLILQVAGRAGRAELSGRVIVQTYNADNYCILAAANYDRAMFLREELPKRKALMYPPYVRTANVLLWGKYDQQVKETAEKLFAQIDECRVKLFSRAWDVLPATPCVLTKVRGNFRYHIVIKASLEVDLSKPLSELVSRFKKPKYVNMAVDIDPVSVL